MHSNLSELGENLVKHLEKEGFSEEEITASAGIVEEEINDLIHEKILKEEKKA